MCTEIIVLTLKCCLVVKLAFTLSVSFFLVEFSILISCLCTILINTSNAVEFPANPTSDTSNEKIIHKENKTVDAGVEDISREEEELNDLDETKDKKFLQDAMKTVLDPDTIIVKQKDVVTVFKHQLEELDRENETIEWFMQEMDKISLEVCKTSQEALWSYMSDIKNEGKKNYMIRIATEEDEMKMQYWQILKRKYLTSEKLFENDTIMTRKLKIIRTRGTNVQIPQSKQKEEINTMQRIWSTVLVCSYNSSDCISEGSVKTMHDVITIFRTSNDTKELSYYWKAYRDITGRKIRPIFQEYVTRMNTVAKREHFKDAGEMWRDAFDDPNFVETVGKLWSEIKTLYTPLYDYVRAKLKIYYKDVLKIQDKHIPAHILGNLWAQEWQSIYPKVVPYPHYSRPQVQENETINSKDLFDAVDEFHQSIGFESSRDSYEDITDTMSNANCLPSSHDMCDGVNYKIKWCGEKTTDIATGLFRAARLLGHVQYAKHYRNLPPIYRDGPNPAFHDALSDIVAIQVSSPEFLKNLNLLRVETGPEVTINRLLWLALEKLPLMGYAFVLDKWRWDVFGNSSLTEWNRHWWDLRTRETGISPPVPRNESDLDPAAKYHVVSHMQYITYLVSHVLEFQILKSLCNAANHSGPLHNCSLHGVKEAGALLSNAMALGASEDWRTVLQTMTGERELSTSGILEYFSELEKFLKEENQKLALYTEDMDKSVPIIVGLIVVMLTLMIVILYFVKKCNVGAKLFSVCSENGSLDIVTNEVTKTKGNDTVAICEDKV